MDATVHANGHGDTQRRQIQACSRRNRLVRHNRPTPVEAASGVIPEPHPVTSNP